MDQGLPENVSMRDSMADAIKDKQTELKTPSTNGDFCVITCKIHTGKKLKENEMREN